MQHFNFPLNITKLILILGLLSLNTNVSAKEVFETYHSDIQVYENGEMLVKETIVAISELNQIKRGIYRDFPLNYKDHFGNHYRVNFEIVGIKRDGNPEKFHTKSIKNGIRIYIGNKNVTLNKGRHKFEIIYKTSRQLGFFDDYDELYWNVTGTKWAFPINRASASVVLPDGIDRADIALTGFTGKYRSRQKNFISNVKQDRSSYFETTVPLKRNEGLTIVVNWPKGFVKEPGLKEKFFYILRDNLGIYIGIVGLLLISVYYVYIWSRVGKDPAEGIIFPHYEPPDNYSPASMRFIRNMGYDNTCFSVALINLAVKGFLKISEHDGDYTLDKLDDSNKQLAPGEQKVLKKLFPYGKSLELKQTNHSRISSAIDAHQASLEKDYEKTYFITNSNYFYLGLFFSFCIILASIFFQLTPETAGPVVFMIFWLSIWTFGVVALLKMTWSAWKQFRSATGFFHAIFTTVFAIPFVVSEFVVFGLVAEQTSWLIPVLIVTAIALNWLFYELLKAPTLAGRELLDKIEGFKRYIDVAEKHDLEYKYSGGKTPELFERILPFAMALGIEQRWSRQFEDELNNSATGQEYSPNWYDGSHWHPRNITSFTTSLGSSLSSTVTSSSRAPGSSSGSGGFSGGGGGFSGGGGGGGGGGGW